MMPLLLLIAVAVPLAVAAFNALVTLHQENPHMRNLLAAVLFIVAPLSAAYAWDTPPAPTPAPAPSARASANPNASASSSAHSTSNAGASARAAGGRSSANASPSQTVIVQPSTGAPASSGGASTAGNVTLTAPSIGIPSVGGGGYDCPVVGMSGGGSGPMGGGGIGPSWISPRCDHRKYAELIATLTGDPALGLAYLASVEKDVAPFIQNQPAAAKVATQGKATPHLADHCYDMDTWTAGEIARHPECGR